jgi:hypothetical protein
LYKQGLFWVAYEQSAYYMWQIKGFKPIKKWYKNSNSIVVQVGFTNIDEVLKTNDIEIIEQQEAYMCFNIKNAIEQQSFEEWKNALTITAPKTQSNSSNCKKETLEERIAQFDISNKTPMEALLFINDLKKVITNGNL